MTILVLLMMTGGSVPGGQTVGAHDCYGAGDLDRDTHVRLPDHAILSGCLGGPGVAGHPIECDPADFGAADLDEDGHVDLKDYALLSLAFGDDYFDYGPHRDDRDAEALAMRTSGEFRAPDDEYERIHRDLQLIRAAYPDLATISTREFYAPDQLLVKLIDDASLRGYVALNFYYLVVDDRLLFGTSRVLTFCDTLNNIPVIAQLYAALPEVERANPNTVFGGGDNIIVTPQGGTYSYTFADGYGDCPSGCTCARIWVVEVNKLGSVEAISCTDTCLGECP